MFWPTPKANSVYCAALSITRSILFFQDFGQPRKVHLLLQCFSPKYCGKRTSLFAVKLDPPSNIQSNITASKCQIWWTVPSYLDEILQYQLQYKEYSTSWEVTGWATHCYSTALPGAMALPLISGSSGSWLLKIAFLFCHRKIKGYYIKHQ